MKKGLTKKQQKENQERAALLQRITDVYSGAQGQKWDEESDFANAELLSNAVPTLRAMFGDQVEADYIWSGHCLRYFDTPHTACDHLFSAGIRSGS